MEKKNHLASFTDYYPMTGYYFTFESEMNKELVLLFRESELTYGEALDCLYKRKRKEFLEILASKPKMQKTFHGYIDLVFLRKYFNSARVDNG